MKKTLPFSMLLIMVLAVVGCDSDHEANMTEVEEKYKTIVIPVVNESKVLYPPVYQYEKVKSISIPIVKMSDAQ